MMALLWNCPHITFFSNSLPPLPQRKFTFRPITGRCFQQSESFFFSSQQSKSALLTMQESKSPVSLAGLWVPSFFLECAKGFLHFFLSSPFWCPITAVTDAPQYFSILQCAQQLGEIAVLFNVFCLNWRLTWYITSLVSMRVVDTSFYRLSFVTCSVHNKPTHLNLYTSLTTPNM